jgi:hypothetical protein
LSSTTRIFAKPLAPWSWCGPGPSIAPHHLIVKITARRHRGWRAE